MNSFSNHSCRIGSSSQIKGRVKAHGLADAAREISPAGGESVQSYEGRMRVFNLGVVVVALIVLTILIERLSTAWIAFEKSIRLTS